MTPGEKLLALLEAMQEAQTLIEIKRAENLLYAHARELTRWAIGRKVPQADFDDVAQEVCLELARGRCKATRPAEAMSWLRTVASNKYRNMLRRERPREPLPPPSPPPPEIERAAHFLRTKVLFAAPVGQRRTIRVFLEKELDGKGPTVDGPRSDEERRKATQNYYADSSRGQAHFAEVAGRISPTLSELQQALARRLSGRRWQERLPESESPPTGDEEDEP